MEKNLKSNEETSIDSRKQTCKTGKFRITKKITKKTGKITVKMEERKIQKR
jgi:hypothetical protein